VQYGQAHSLIAAFGLAAFAPAAWAAEAEYSGTFCGHVKRNVLESNPDVTVVATETWAIQTPTSTFKPWENATVHCVGCACGSSGGAACGAGGVMAWKRGAGAGERGRGGR
jgi:hypothetical protein